MSIVALPIAAPFQVPVGNTSPALGTPPYTVVAFWYQGQGHPLVSIRVMPSSITGVAGGATLAHLRAQGIIV